MTKVKICGIKSLADALAAIEAGADYLGFNFYPRSVRFIEKQACAEITSTLKKEYQHVKLVGVFVNSSIAEVEDVLNTCFLHLAQLHGDETPEMVAAFEGRAFKAIRLRSSESVETSVYPFLRSVPESVHPFAEPFVDSPAFLVDAAMRGVYGGSGVTADWNSAAELAKQYPLLLAGGLTPENVAEAVRQVRPWGVDVASGVESAPGEKDPSRMKAFVRAVQSENRD
jgi:phosphoribosylanthranilate isomerase